MTAEARELQRRLFTTQNPDGGWGYRPGSSPSSSWTEPTALSLLSLAAHGEDGSAAYQRGCSWLLAGQREDGGWAPNPAIETTTWVTNLALLAAGDRLPQSKVQSAVAHILQQVNGETPVIERMLSQVTGIPPAKAPGGSPWYPGTASWIGPSVLSVLALNWVSKNTAAHSPANEQLAPLTQRGRQYILSRKCRDGGWNHGGASFRSEDAESYPEMTGMALLALRQAPEADLEPSLRRAESYLQRAQSTEAVCWLQLGLMTHGKPVDTSSQPRCRSLRDACLRLLVLAGPQSTNRLLSAT